MAELKLLPSAGQAEPALRSVPQLLRNIAQGIEDGLYGVKEAKEKWPEVVCRGALVLRVSGMGPQIFGLGDVTAEQSYMDFHAGAQELMGMQHPERA